MTAGTSAASASLRGHSALRADRLPDHVAKFFSIFMAVHRHSVLHGRLDELIFVIRRNRDGTIIVTRVIAAIDE
jgi:hypothetical protein